jgi:FAD:protein FMN transferase
MRAERTFHAMGTDVHVVLVDAEARLLDRAQDRIIDLQQRWSRFLPNSEISALNRDAGHALRVSRETVELVQRALDAYRLTDGLFDPTVLGAVLRAGYDRSFEALDGARPTEPCDLVAGAQGVEIDGDRVRLPDNTGFDPGGIGKGLAADLVARELLDAGAAGVCVSLGGDVRVAGSAPEGDAWTIDVLHPDLDEPVARLGVRDGAVATSTTLRRRWAVGGDTRHHLIDPRTGRPSTTRRAFATVVAGYAWAADVLAKTLVLDTRPDPFALLRCSGAEALVVDAEHRVVTTFGLAAFTGRAS